VVKEVRLLMEPQKKGLSSQTSVQFGTVTRARLRHWSLLNGPLSVKFVTFRCISYILQTAHGGKTMHDFVDIKHLRKGLDGN
jgi:hypothetical protein